MRRGVLGPLLSHEREFDLWGTEPALMTGPSEIIIRGRRIVEPQDPVEVESIVAIGPDAPDTATLERDRLRIQELRNIIASARRPDEARAASDELHKIIERGRSRTVAGDAQARAEAIGHDEPVPDELRRDGWRRAHGTNVPDDRRIDVERDGRDVVVRRLDDAGARGLRLSPTDARAVASAILSAAHDADPNPCAVHGCWATRGHAVGCLEYDPEFDR